MMMRILIMLLLCLPYGMDAQYMQGTVRDKESGRLLTEVLVVNSKTQRYTYTNDSGYYMLQAATGDTVVFLLSFYQVVRKAATHRVEDIQMNREKYSLEEVEVLPELEKLEQEHRELLKTYDKTLTDAKRKPKFNPYAGTMAGFTVDGLVSDMASRISGKRKRDKRFLRTFETMQEQKFVATRYNPDVVMATTKTTADSAIAFINDNPMPRDFAMESTSLELMMWIREHYNLWAQKEKQGNQPAKRPD